MLLNLKANWETESLSLRDLPLPLRPLHAHVSLGEIDIAPFEGEFGNTCPPARLSNVFTPGGKTL
jgi:hypothetical protein